MVVSYTKLVLLLNSVRPLLSLININTINSSQPYQKFVVNIFDDGKIARTEIIGIDIFADKKRRVIPYIRRQTTPQPEFVSCFNFEMTMF